jgi:hypothetical protein
MFFGIYIRKDIEASWVWNMAYPVRVRKGNWP